MPLIFEPQITKLNCNANVYICVVNFPDGEMVKRTYCFMVPPDLTEIASDFSSCVHIRRNFYYYLKSTTHIIIACMSDSRRYFGFDIGFIDHKTRDYT
jgi:hypothetical protein